MTKARTTKPTEVPGIPKPPADVSPALRRYLESISEALEIRLGRRGDARDRAITLRELLDSGLAVELANNPYNIDRPPPPPPPPPPPSATPTAPTNFTATGGYSLITCFWDYPNYGPHSHTEIWRHDANVIGDAQLVGISSGISFVDPVGEGASYYYWARHVSLYDIQGPFNSANGTLAETALDVEELLEVLTGAITESQLYADLGARIDLIDAGTELAGSVNARIKVVNDALLAETSARIAAISAETSARITAIQNEADARAAAILAEATARGTAITNEATIRSDADTALASSISTVSAVVNTKNRVYRQAAAPTANLVVGDVWYDSDDGNKVYRWDGSSWVLTDDSRIAANTAAIQTEATARADGDSAQALARETLAAQIRGSYTGTDVTQLSSGLVYSERQARVTADSALASRSDALEATVNNPTTGLVATRATLINDYYTKVATDSAIASSASSLTTTFNNTLTGYVTNSNLTTNYYTKSATDSAISAATTNLVSNTALNNALSNYVTSATLSANYLTATDTNSAIAAATQNLVSSTTFNNTLLNYVTSATLTTGYYTKTETDSAISSATQNLVSTTLLNNTLGNYVTNATLTNNYYTATQTDSAISAATTNLVSTTTLNNTLGSYVTNATLTNGYYTKTQTDSAISASVQNLVSTTTLNNTLSSYVTTATLTNSYYTKTETDSAISSASNTLTATFNNTLTNYATTAAVQQNYYAKASGEALEGQYTVKIDLNGYVSGFGLASTAPVNGTPSSEFIVRADRFSIASPGQTTIIPFIVQATPTTINGVSVPAGVYMNDAYIRNGTITNAKIGNAAIDDAKIASLSADKIIAGTIDTARLAIDNVTLDSYYDGSIGRNRLRIRDLGVDTAKITDAAITTAKIGDLAVSTLKIAGNAITQPQTYTASDIYVTTALTVSGGGYVYVGFPNGDYIYDFDFGFIYVGPGNGDYIYSSGGSVSGGHVAIETPQINVGIDSTAAVQIVFYGFCDGSNVNDGGQLLYMMVDKYVNGAWTGYQTVASSRVGARTTGGDTQSVFSIAMAHTATNLQNIRIKVLVGSQAVHLALGTSSQPTYLRNVTVSILGAKR